jgi:hypothetical protein
MKVTCPGCIERDKALATQTLTDDYKDDLIKTLRRISEYQIEEIDALYVKIDKLQGELDNGIA